MSQIIYGLTATSDEEIKRALTLLKGATVGRGFIHETYQMNDANKFTRSWFAWANTLFGELIAKLALEKPELLKA